MAQGSFQRADPLQEELSLLLPLLTVPQQTQQQVTRLAEQLGVGVNSALFLRVSCRSAEADDYATVGQAGYHGALPVGLVFYN